MATKKPANPFVGVDVLKHADDKRRNIPTAEFPSLMADEARKSVQVSYSRGMHVESTALNDIEAA